MNSHPAVQNGIAAANAAAETRLGCRIQKRFARQQGFAVDVSFEAAPGFTILFGASGAGKTTLLDCVAGLTRPDSGRIAIGDRVVFDSSSSVNLPVAERRVGYEWITVEAGDRIGNVGLTGITTGAHVHWSVWQNGELIDPLSLIRG